MEFAADSEDASTPTGTLGIYGMVGVGFFWVSGGMFGNELLVNSAPPGVVLIFVVVVACTYAIPSALVSAELSTYIPEDGGAIVWAERAFGFTFAMHNAWWTWVSFVFDVSLYPVLAGDYALQGGLLDCPAPEFYANATCPAKYERRISALCPTSEPMSGKYQCDGASCAAACAFPFDYNNVTYTGCTDTINPSGGNPAGVMWCEGYTEGTWGDCAMTGNTTMPPFITLDQGAQWFGNCQGIVAADTAEVTDEEGFFNPSRSAFAMVMVGCITLIKLNGLEVIVKLSMVMSLCSLAPAVFWVVMSLGDLDIAEMTRLTGQPIRWSLLLSFVVWLNIGWVGLGALAGQVKDPVSTYPKAVCILFLVSCVVNVMPVVVSVSQHDQICDPMMTLFEPGFFGVLAGQKFGCWLQVGFKIGSFLANVGLYNAQILLAEFTMVYLLEKLFPAWCRQKERAGGWMWAKQDGVAPVHVLSNGAVVMFLVWIPASSLVECSSLLAALTVQVVMASFILLRINEAMQDRPYRLPVNSIWGVILTLAIPVLVGAATIIMNALPPLDTDGMSASDTSNAYIGYFVRVSCGLLTVISGVIFMRYGSYGEDPMSVENADLLLGKESINGIRSDYPNVQGANEYDSSQDGGMVLISPARSLGAMKARESTFEQIMVATNAHGHHDDDITSL